MDSTVVETTLIFTTAGKIFMVSSWIIIILLVIYSFYNVFKDRGDQVVGPLEVEAEIDREESTDKSFKK